ncbi:hypothetical protein CEXT_294001 [Caerostris extrusa]|uniref:Uncharacterized protein n=1 Tax=Caerostris extrusa TaxID=172846 RepID=A0AAV4M4S5_CAEEX|nr:hypothetical protein CEXT_294001 [Caerostris extrusa]
MTVRLEIARLIICSPRESGQGLGGRLGAEGVAHNAEVDSAETVGILAPGSLLKSLVCAWTVLNQFEVLGSFANLDD